MGEIMLMAESQFERKLNDRVTFEMFVRRLPENRDYLITAGLGTLLWYLRHMQFTGEDYEYLLQEGFDDHFASWLLFKTLGSQKFFTGDLYAVPEGIPVGAQTPILRMTGSRAEITILESLVLSIINHQTMVASKASRIVQAANGRDVWDFSLRRLHGPEAAIGVARAAYIAGCEGTATMEAGKLLGIPTTGTMAHHFVMAYGPDQEQIAFEDFLSYYPQKHALLIDTYDIANGLRNAQAASEETGIALNAVRLDSDDLGYWSRVCRDHLDGVGQQQCKIIVSNDLDEHAIRKLHDAPIDGFGVGTMLGTSADAPNLGGVFKLVEQHERNPRYVMKIAGEKSTDPGTHQVWRNVRAGVDTLALDSETGPMFSRPLLVPFIQEGKKVKGSDALDNARTRVITGLQAMPKDGWHLQRSDALIEIKTALTEGP
jgi:nicotinate phosphoribosyltransferase